MSFKIKTQMWVEKYRPKSLDEITAHEDIVFTIRQFIREKKLPHLLLYGPPGTGKTSIILALARELYSNSFTQMTLELNASDDRGIAVVREEIQAFASTIRSFASGFKLVILDECDSMTKDAQFALRRIIEQYTKYTRFCLICNYSSKIIPALQSRCTKLRFEALKPKDIREKIHAIAQMENLNIDINGLKAICEVGCGDMRKTLNILQSAHLASQDLIDEKLVYSIVGQLLPRDVEKFCESLLAVSFKKALHLLIAHKKSHGLTLSDIVHAMIGFTSRLHLSSSHRIDLLKDLCDVDRSLSCAANEYLKLLHFISVLTKLKLYLSSKA